MELKPCPFCGGEVHVNKGSSKCIRCDTCVSIDYYADKDFPKKEKVWNTRPIEDALQKRIAELEAYADTLAAGLPEGMLPKDVEIIREQNWKMVARIAELEGELSGLKPTCCWTSPPDYDNDGWETGCGNEIILNDGTPEDNKFSFCPYCGCEIVELLRLPKEVE